MVDFDMNILNDPNVGKSHLPFLDETEAQIKENIQADAEGRLPRRVLPRERFGIYADRNTVGPIEYSNESPEVDEKSLEQYFTDQEMERDSVVVMPEIADDTPVDEEISPEISETLSEADSVLESLSSFVEENKSE